GTLAQILPPSLVLIIMADQLGRSVGDMYRGALIPGLLLTLLYAAYVFLVSVLSPKSAPALPESARTLMNPDGSRGTTSLGVILALAVFSSWFFSHSYYGDKSAPSDEVMIYSALVGIGVAFLVALL